MQTDTGYRIEPVQNARRDAGATNLKMKPACWPVLAFLLAGVLAACAVAPAHMSVRTSPTPSPRPATPTMTYAPGQEIPLLMASPTPLATPARGADAYRLRTWDPQAALDLVDTAQQFAYDDNVPWFVGTMDDRFNYASDQQAIRLAALDALQRFPKAGFKEKLEWRVALANAILGSPDSDTWILQQVENQLNTEHYKPEGLNEPLNLYGFAINVSAPLDNLLGSGQPGRVIDIRLMERKATALYAALAQDGQGRYRAVKIFSAWSFNRADDRWSLALAEDHTGDGVPEISITQWNKNGSYVGNETFIFQWQDGHFADLSRGQLYLTQSGGVEGIWQYGTPDANGVEPIEVEKGADYVSDIIQFERYEWNGAWYQLAESRVETPETLYSQTAEWITSAMGAGDYPFLIRELPLFLSSPSKIDAVQLGHSYVDYLRFQLAQAYALNAQRAPARETLRQVITQPNSQLTTAISQAAQAYLERYKSQGDLYRACQAALAVMQQAAGEHLYSWETADEEYVTQAWGYQGFYVGYRGVCSLPRAFIGTVGQLRPAQFSQAPGLLRAAGVAIRSGTPLDLNGDGQAEWVLLADTPGDDAPLDMWVLINTPEKILALPVVDWSRRQYDLPREATDALQLQIKTVSAPDGKTVSFLKLGTHLYIFQLNVGDVVLQLYDLDHVDSYAVRQNAGQLEFEITHIAGYCCQDIYGWSTAEAKWIIDPQEAAYEALSTQAEAAMLSRWQPGAAIPLLQKLLERPDINRGPYLMYLLGLAYELKGDENAAVQTYWKLWQSYPESAYARLVQARLELRK